MQPQSSGNPSKTETVRKRRIICLERSLGEFFSHEVTNLFMNWSKLKVENAISNILNLFECSWTKCRRHKDSSNSNWPNKPNPKAIFPPYSLPNAEYPSHYYTPMPYLILCPMLLVFNVSNSIRSNKTHGTKKSIELMTWPKKEMR